jgi:uncharacterized membrane protein YagU involved in acid resistance
MKNRFSLQSALISGVAATLAMTIFTYMAPLMGFEMNIPKMLATTMKSSIIVGWIIHFMIGEILAINYAIFFLKIVNKKSNFKAGAIFGIFPWLMAQVFVMPMMMSLNGGSFISGFFSGSIIVSMASLMGHLIYGSILGLLYKPEVIMSKVTA